MKGRLILAMVVLIGAGWGAYHLEGAQRFPPPEFETGHQLPTTTAPPARGVVMESVDVSVLLASLGVGCYLVYRKRSRWGLVGLGIFSLLYFGFYRKGCICAIGSVQNVALALFDNGYAVPWSVLVFFLAPLVVSLIAGRVFCAGVCPHGALQDLVLIKPLKVPVWLEEALGLVPFLFLGAGIVYAATGTAFVICRYDPIVPVFRMTGSVALVVSAVLLVVLGMFVGRPYCRFLCPYGALLRVTASVSRWRVRVTPDYCTQCRLCEESCPFGAMRVPSAAPQDGRVLDLDRRRLGWMLLLLPVMVGVGGWVGSGLSVAASRVHATVSLMEKHTVHQRTPIKVEPQSATALALARAETHASELLAEAMAIRNRFRLAGWLFGGWVGLVVGLKLTRLSVRQGRSDYEPDRGACYACARCFRYCPNEQVRLGLLPASALPAPPTPMRTGSGPQLDSSAKHP